MSELAAKDGGVKHTVVANIIHVLASAAKKAQIFNPLDRSADERVLSYFF